MPEFSVEQVPQRQHPNDSASEAISKAIKQSGATFEPIKQSGPTFESIKKSGSNSRKPHPVQKPVFGGVPTHFGFQARSQVARWQAKKLRTFGPHLIDIRIRTNQMQPYLSNQTRRTHDYCYSQYHHDWGRTRDSSLFCNHFLATIPGISCTNYRTIN